MFLEGLDALDQKIVRLLIENARASYSEIGEQVGISRVAVKARIQALEQRGIIEEYTTIVNPQKISGAVSCYFEIETQPETLAEVIETLRQNETVTQIYRVTGRDKLHVHAVAASGFSSCNISEVNRDRFFSDADEMIRWIDQPSIVPFVRALPEGVREKFRDEVVRAMLDRTLQADGTCFETFRRIHVRADK